MKSTQECIIKTILFSASLLLFFSCTIVKHDDQQNKSEEGVTFYFESEDFDAASFVKDNWDTKIMAEFHENAQDLTLVLNALRTNQEEAIKKYGRRKGETDPYNFMVKGIVPVKELDRSSSAGLLYLDVPDLSGENSLCTIQVGPVIKRSSVRDSLSFISFGDFENQIEYANISREINFYIRDTVVNTIDESYNDTISVRFTGVFALGKSGSVLITPVELERVGGETP